MAVFCWFAALLVPHAAAVPATFSQQGRFTDASGAPLTGTHTLTFRVYDGPSGGDTRWEEAQDVTFTAGVYHVTLGGREPIPDGALGDDTWLEVSLDGTVMSPRQRVHAAPFARVAGRAERVRWSDVDGVPVDVDALETRVASLESTRSTTDTALDDVAAALTAVGAEIAALWDATTTLLTDLADLGDRVFLLEAGFAGLAASAFSGSWRDLRDVPGDLADGDDDSLGTLACVDGDVVTWDAVASEWSCAATPASGSCTYLGTDEDAGVLRLDCGGAETGVAMRERFATVAVGNDGACGVTTAGRLRCWGRMSSWPSGVTDGTSVREVSRSYVSGGYVCVVLDSGEVRCNMGTVPASIGTDAQRVRVGRYGACAQLTDGTLHCWNTLGMASYTPTGAFTHFALRADDDTTGCGVLTDGSVSCWDRMGPTTVTLPAGSYTSVDAGGNCGVTSGGDMRCVGGHGTAFTRTSATGYSWVTSGPYTMCAGGPDEPTRCQDELLDTALGRVRLQTLTEGGNGAACGITPSGYLRCASASSEYTTWMDAHP